MIKAGELENREDAPMHGQIEADAGIQRMKAKPPKPAPAPVEALPQIAERIEAARSLRPPRLGPEHCGCCFGQGRDAAIRVIEGGEG